MKIPRTLPNLSSSQHVLKMHGAQKELDVVSSVQMYFCGVHQSSNHHRFPAKFQVVHLFYYHHDNVHLGTWWFTPLSKWVITRVINGISGVSPLITRVKTHLLSGMNHQVYPPISRHTQPYQILDQL